MYARMAGLTALVIAALATSAQAAVVVKAVETTAGNVRLTGSGSLNTAAWSFSGVFARAAVVDPFSSVEIGGDRLVPFAEEYVNPVSFDGPPDFAIDLSALSASADLVTGDRFGLDFDGPELLIVPVEYQGGLLEGTSTYLGMTFEDLNMAVGTYVWTWGVANNADSFTLDIVPEPSSALLIALGLVGLAARRDRREGRQTVCTRVAPTSRGWRR